MPASPEQHGWFFVLVGPPGVGKNALMNAALEKLDHISQLATATTRPMRKTEQQGREHLFVTRETFWNMVANDELLEWQQVHLNLYGIPKHTIDAAIQENRDLTADIDVLGATYIRSLYPDHVILIFIQPPSIEELENRMRTRGEPEVEIAQRMKRVMMEMEYESLCDYVITNDDFEQAAARLIEVIQSKRQGTAKHLTNFTHAVETIGVYEHNALCHNSEPRFPEVQLQPAEIPNDAALHVFADVTGIPIESYTLLTPPTHQGSFVPPISIDVRQQTNPRQICFRYIVTFNHYVEPPKDWQWVNYHDLHLPDDILETLDDLAELSTSE
ncbi:MAG: guanylate kinase [Anaerolineae bacterium]|nr:guanylate kinase [Anaerolineae bacterium]